ncbi:MAG: hypothetical protein IK078_04610 [Lachnospiraceae bacterium]|nr:hypothetical protein [Lachnospiraceae bacterium]
MKKKNVVTRFLLCMLDGMLFISVLLLVNDLVQIVLEAIDYKKNIKESLKEEKGYYKDEEDDE